MFNEFLAVCSIRKVGWFRDVHLCSNYDDEPNVEELIEGKNSIPPIAE
jgi:hypothetical protein